MSVNLTAIQLVSTDDLVSELKSRFDDLIMCGAVNDGDKGSEYIWYTTESTPACYGLALYIGRVLKDTLFASLDPFVSLFADDEDED